MKKFGQIAVIALFVAALWVPLLCTPFRAEHERSVLKSAEQREPDDGLSFAAFDGDVGPWVAGVQSWYRDSFAFRSYFLNLYHGAHYLIRNYPGEVFGEDGHVLIRGDVKECLSPLSSRHSRKIRRNLSDLRQVCDEAGVEAVFIVIPSKITVCPQLTPQWVRARCFGQSRANLIGLIRSARFPVFDLSNRMKAYAEKTGKPPFLKYDCHWNMEGAIQGYREMMNVLRVYCPDARTIPQDRYSLVWNEHMVTYTKRRYLDWLLSEPIAEIGSIDLPPVRILSSGVEKYATWYSSGRRDVAEIFCPLLGTQTVLFVRDSFLASPSPLLNHSLPHIVYLNFSKEGRWPREAIARYHPDLLVVALQESVLKKALLGFRFPHENQ